VPSTFFVDDRLVAGDRLAQLGARLTLDRDGSGTLTDGDQVTFALGEANQTAALTYRAAATALAPEAGDTGTAFETVGNALASAAVGAGDTVSVAAGTYHEAVALGKAVVLQGSGSALTFLDGAGSGTGLDVTAASATISGFTVQDFALGLSATAATTSLSLADVRLTGNTVGGTLAGVATVTVTGDDTAETWLVGAGAFGRAGEDSVGFSGVANLTVNAAGGDDTLFVTGTAAGTAVHVLGGAGDDTIVVTSAAGTLNTFASPLAVDGGAGANQLQVTEINSSVADTVTVTATALSGTTVPWHVDYTATDGTFGRGVFFTAGAGDDTLNIQGTAAGGPTGVYGWDGNDVFNVNDSSTNGSRNPLVGPLHVEGNAGTNKLSVDGLGSSSYSYQFGPSYGSTVTLSANAMDDGQSSIMYTATGGTFGQGVALTSGSFHQLNVQGLAAEAPTTVTGSCSFTSAIGPAGSLAGPVSISVDGGYRRGFPRVFVSEEGPVGDVLTVSQGEIRSLARPFVLRFGSLGGLRLGSGDDYVRVLGPNGPYDNGSSTSPSTISTGGGNDMIVVGTTTGQLLGLGDVSLDAGGGTGGTLYVTAAGEAANGEYTIGGLESNAVGIGGISFGSISGSISGRGGTIFYKGAFGGGIYFVGAADHTNTVKVSGTAANARTVVFGGDAADVFSIEGDNASAFQGDLVLVT
jgi:hypothetical protein